MQILRKNVRVDLIVCEGDLADIQAQLNRFVEKPTDAGIGVALELFPIVVKSNPRGKFKLVAGHRTFLLARSRLTADVKIPVSELVGKVDDSELFGPACELFGALFFTQSAESLAARLEPFKNDRSLALVARDLSAPKHFDEIFKESGPKKRTRRSKVKEELQDGSDGPQSAAESLGAGQDSQTTGMALDAVAPAASGVADASTAPEQLSIAASAAPVDNAPASDASEIGTTPTPSGLACDETTNPVADPEPNTQVEVRDGSDGPQSAAESLEAGQDTQTTWTVPDVVEPVASGVADASKAPEQPNPIEAGAAPVDNVPTSDASEIGATATSTGLAGDEMTNPAPSTQLDPAVESNAETSQASPPAIIRRRRRRPKSDSLKSED